MDKNQNLKEQKTPAKSPLLPAAVQNELFSDEEFASGRELVEAYEAKPGKFSGKILERRKELVDTILMHIVDGWSALAISKVYRISRNSIQALIQRAEDDGRIAAFENRLAGALKYNVMLSTEVVQEHLESGNATMKDAYMNMGISADKLFVLLGKATSRVEHSYKDNSKEYEADVKALIEEGKKLLEEKKVAIDVESRTEIQGVQADPVRGDT
tara:strand:- start:11006 stop:11647 length:642 start_codon:yes stop_codon:yes gene_type:complete